MSVTRASIDRKLDRLSAYTAAAKDDLLRRASIVAVASASTTIAVWWWRHRRTARRRRNLARRLAFRARQVEARPPGWAVAP
jgi:hypothetical protein